MATKISDRERKAQDGSSELDEGDLREIKLGAVPRNRADDKSHPLVCIQVGDRKTRTVSYHLLGIYGTTE